MHEFVIDVNLNSIMVLVVYRLAKSAVHSLIDRCHTCNFIARFCRATLSRDKNCKCDMPCRTLQLCRVNKNWPISVHRIFATKLLRIERCSNRKTSCATVEKLSDTPCHTCDFVAR